MSMGTNAQIRSMNGSQSPTGGFQMMRTRIAKSGRTLYDEQINDSRNLIYEGFTDDVSYNPYMVDYDNCCPVMIKMYGQSYTAAYGFASKFFAPHNKPIELGQLLYDTKREEYWLCVESYDIDGIYNEGRLGKCGRFLRWQDKDGIIKQTPMIVTSASKYNNGEDGVTVIQVGSDQLMVYLQLNEDTVLLDRGMKFFVDENKYNPSVYELTRNDTALYSYMGKGFLSLILTECAYTPTEKEFELGVCDYQEPSSYKPPKPVEVPPKTPDEKPSILTANIIGKPSMRVGFPRTYTVEFMSDKQERVDWHNINFEWYLNCHFADEITQQTNDNQIILAADNEELIGASFLLQVKIVKVDDAGENPEVTAICDGEDSVVAQLQVEIEEGW